jgi:hypothetical protein
MTPIHMQLEVVLSNGDIHTYVSLGVWDEIGKVTSARCRKPNGSEYSIPASGDIVGLCKAYPECGATTATLILHGGKLAYRDESGRGTITAVSQIDPVEGCEQDVVNTCLAEVAKKFCNRSGRSLFRVVGGVIRSSNVTAVLGSCNSLIKLIVNTPNFKTLELLHARVPANNGPGLVQRYTMGGDIVHLFTDGKAVLNRTVDGQFQSVPVEIADGEEWIAVVVPPDEYYQVINMSTDQDLEYYWFFLEHEDAYNREGVRSLTKKENDQKGWKFVYDG